MSAPSLSLRLAQTWRSMYRPSICNQCSRTRRLASTQVAAASADPAADLEDSTSLSQNTIPTDTQGYDPVSKAKERQWQLPRSRYQYRPPRYDRGPLHPHRVPHPSDPASREFVPGPFSMTRMEQTYHNVIAPDFMTLCYQHIPPGFRAPQKGPRLREWEGDNPYFENRQKRGPRGGDVLRLLRKPVTFGNIPKIERVTVHAFCAESGRGNSQPLHVAGLLVQSLTGKRVQVHQARVSVSQWALVRGKSVSVTADLKGEEMYHFLSKLITIVLPRIKDWRGVRATSGDSSGNLSFGLEPETVATFPEIETNYDAYPPKMIPGLFITIHTSATCDKDARLLLQQAGIPFYGKIVN